jgi:signal peptidase I
MKIAAKWAGNILSLIFILLLILALYSGISTRLNGGEPNLLGYQVKAVLSGSMEPSIQTGSIIAIKPTTSPDKYKKGDVITYKSIDNPNVLITHRIVEAQRIDSQIHYTTKGDNNDGNDNKPIPSSNVVGHYEGFTVPYIGYGLSFYNTDAGKIFLLIIPGILLVGYAGITIWRTIASIEEKDENDSPETPKTV